MDRIPNAHDLTQDEMVSLRLVIARSFLSKAAFPAPRRARLVELGLVQGGMGGFMPTPMGRMVGRR